MRTIGLIGGMSWESSAEYYRLLNGLTRERLGGHHCASSVMVTVDFAEIEAMQRADDWQGAATLLAEAAVSLERAGAELVVLCTNTMHRVADDIAAAIRIPFVDIIDATAQRIRAAGMRTVGLLGTRFTMEGEFYRARMAEHGIEVLTPDAPERALVHDVIYDELTRGLIHDSSRQEFTRIIGALAARGAEGVILGCTEIPLLIGPADTPVPLFDTTRLHVEHAVELALAAPDAVPGDTSAPARPATAGKGAEAVPSEPRDPNRDQEREAALSQAVRLREQGQAAQARERLLALAQRHPQDAEIAYQTAWVHDVLGLEAEAVPFYERALAEPDLTEDDRHGAFLGLGSTYRVLGRHAQAVRTLRRGLAEFPNDPSLQAFLAMALYNTGQSREAVRILLASLAATSSDRRVREYRRAVEHYADDLDGGPAE